MRRRRFVKQAVVLVGGAAAGMSLPAPLTGLSGVAQATSSGAVDLVLRNSLVYDGSGGPPFEADVAVTAGRIMEVGVRLAARGTEELDLGSLALAPGFIDIHSHTDLALLRSPLAESKVRQGVTTEVTGQDGSSVWWSDAEYAAARDRYRRDGIELEFRDLPGFLRHFDTHGAAVNVASMVGTGTVREVVVGMNDRPATEQELARMVALVREALGAGACGLSSGLEYTPGAFADAAELEALATPLRGTGLPFASHMRNEDDRLLAALEEVIGVGQRSGVAVQVSHLKAQGQRNWWKTGTVLRLLESARESGTDVRFDCYPYVAYATGLTNLFPIWAREGGTDAFLARLRDPAQAPRIERAVRDKIALLGSWDAVQLTSASNPQYSWVAGRRLGELAKARTVEPYVLLLDIINGDRARTGTVGFGMSEENVARKLAHPLAMVCSDGGVVTRADGTPHPRNYGTFPRVLGRFCRELKALPLEDAVRKMTSLPAARLRFADRGRVAVGAVADLVAFDSATVADRATFEDPHQYPVGIPHVIVNGAFVIKAGEHTGALPGRSVRPSAPAPAGTAHG